MRITRFPILSVIILLAMVLIGGVLMTVSRTDAHQANVLGARPTPPERPSIVYNDGAPAITPKSNATPAFTVADVKQYFSTHPFSGGSTVSHKPFLIQTVQFITSREASRRLGGETIGLRDSSLVCFVVLRGPFVMSSMHLLSGEKIPTSPAGVEVFDAHTGNELLWGAYS